MVGDATYSDYGLRIIRGGGTSSALALTKVIHEVDSDAGGDIFTLADGTNGQTMTIVQQSSTGISTITPATFTGGTNVTLDAAGDSVTLAFLTTRGWYVTGGNSYSII